MTILLPPAKIDIREAAKWYNEQKKGLGKRLSSQFRNKIHTIAQHSFAFAIRHGVTSTAQVEVFPYLIHFTIEENKTILISAVFHTSQDPQKWLDRE